MSLILNIKQATNTAASLNSFIESFHAAISALEQLLIFVRGIDENCTVYEELVKMCCLKVTTTGEDLLHHVKQVMDSLRLSWEK